MHSKWFIIKIHRYTFIKKMVITTNLDYFNCAGPSNAKEVNIPEVSIKTEGGDGPPVPQGYTFSVVTLIKRIKERYFHKDS